MMQKGSRNGRDGVYFNYPVLNEPYTDTIKEKGKGKGRKGHGPQDQGKGQGGGKGEANYVSPSQTSQSNSQQAALPSSSDASGYFVTHFSMYLTSVKMIGSEEQQREPDCSGCAFFMDRSQVLLRR